MKYSSVKNIEGCATLGVRDFRHFLPGETTFYGCSDVLKMALSFGETTESYSRYLLNMRLQGKLSSQRQVLICLSLEITLRKHKR